MALLFITVYLIAQIKGKEDVTMKQRLSELARVFLFDEDVWEKAYAKAHIKDLNKGLLDRYRKPSEREKLWNSICNGTFKFKIPHKAEIPKPDSKEMRVVIISGGKNDVDRLLLAVLNESLMKVFGHILISKRSKAYQTGLSCGKVVEELGVYLCEDDGNIIVKIDFTKYFDRISKEVIFAFLDLLEVLLGFEKGTEPLINLMRRMFLDDRVKELDKTISHQWLGIRQGNPVSAFFANIVLKELDDYMSEKYPFYVRYSDDLICIGKSEKEIISDIENIIEKYSVSLNKKKTDVYTKDDWFKFLGFNCKKEMLSLSQRRWNEIQDEILKVTLDIMPIEYEKAVDNVCRVLYGNGDDYSWATACLPVINVEKDVKTFDHWVMDVLRVVRDGAYRPHKNNHGSYNAIGKCGCDMQRKDFTLVRHQGNWVAVLKKLNPAPLEYYYSVTEAWREIKMSRDLFACSVRTRKL